MLLYASACLAASAAAAFFFLGARAGRPLGASLGASSLPLVASVLVSSSAALPASGSCTSLKRREKVMSSLPSALQERLS